MCNLLAEAEEGVVEGVAASYSLLTQREPQHQVMLHVVHVSITCTHPVSRLSESEFMSIHQPLWPTKYPAWSQKSGLCSLGDGQEPRSSTNIMEPGLFSHFISLCHQARSQS